MRIVGGKLRGRRINQPDTTRTRPLSDKARESLFNILGDIEALRFADVYAGSGAVGLEALSRGASRAIGVESATAAARVIRDNVRRLGLEASYTLLKQPVEDWLKETAGKEQFDVIYSGPPFGIATDDIATRLAALLAPGGTLVVETSRKEAPLDIARLELVKSRRYGESVLSFYKKSS